MSPQQEAAGCDPLDELYDTLAEVVGAEDKTECYKSYLLVPENTHHSAHQDQAPRGVCYGCLKINC